MPDIVLMTNTENPFLSLREVHLESDGANYRSVPAVRSRGLSCEMVFWFEPSCLKRFINDVASMVDSLSGSARLGPLFEDDYVEFEVDHLGHLAVQGEVFEHSDRPQHLRFEFRTDKTVLEPFLRDLRKWRKLEPGQAGGTVL